MTCCRSGRKKGKIRKNASRALLLFCEIGFVRCARARCNSRNRPAAPPEQTCSRTPRADAVAADEEIRRAPRLLPAGEVHAHSPRRPARTRSKVWPRVIACLRDGRPHEPLQPVPRGEESAGRCFFGDHAAPSRSSVIRLMDLDARESRVPAPLFSSTSSNSGVRGDAGAAADPARRVSARKHRPAQPIRPQERRGEEARHRAADDDGARACGVCFGIPALNVPSNRLRLSR